MRRIPQFNHPPMAQPLVAYLAPRAAPLPSVRDSPFVLLLADDTKLERV